MFVGGPVSPDAVIALARGKPDELDSFVPVLGDLGTIDLAQDPLDLGGSLDRLRVFVGCAGWAPGQLENELAQNAWLTVPAQPEVIFDLPCEERLPAAMQLLGFDLANLSDVAGHA